MDRPEHAAAIEYLRRKGRKHPPRSFCPGCARRSRSSSKASTVCRKPCGPGGPGPTSWSVHEIVDHLVESHRPAVLELRALVCGHSARRRTNSRAPYVRTSTRTALGSARSRTEGHSCAGSRTRGSRRGRHANRCEGAICHGGEGVWSKCSRGCRVGRSARLEGLRAGATYPYTRALCPSRASCGGVVGETRTHGAIGG